jgi:succinoglycan biosynthesis transport protein ExoP
MRSKVAAEVGNANSAVEREARVARQNMADLQRAMDQQRKRILDLQHNQDEYAVLKRDEESARTAYDSAMQRGNETQLESRLKNTNTAILNYAFVPMKPSSPRLLLNVALAFILGSMLAVGTSLTKERFDQRIHTEGDLLEGAGIAVLAELPRMHISRRRYRRPRAWFRSKGAKTRMEPKIVERLS